MESPATKPVVTDASCWWVYMVQTQRGKLYTGITNDVDRRFAEHQSGRKGARFFRSDPAVRVVYREQAANRSEASKREAAIKKLSRAKKLLLVAEQQSVGS